MSSEPNAGTAQPAKQSDDARALTEAASYFSVADQLIPELALVASHSFRWSTTLLAAHVIEWLLKSYIAARTAGADGAAGTLRSADATQDLRSLWERAAQLGLQSPQPEWIGLVSTLYDRPYEVHCAGIEGLVLPVAKRALRSVVQLSTEIRPLIK